jgi:hypothetical protein
MRCNWIDSLTGHPICIYWLEAMPPFGSSVTSCD